MASYLRGNCIVAQSGGPTAVMNASLTGIVQEALQYEEIEEIYGALNGILGVLDENIIDLTEERNKTILALRKQLVLLKKTNEQLKAENRIVKTELNNVQTRLREHDGRGRAARTHVAAVGN